MAEKFPLIKQLWQVQQTEKGSLKDIFFCRISVRYFLSQWRNILLKNKLLASQNSRLTRFNLNSKTLEFPFCLIYYFGIQLIILDKDLWAFLHLTHLFHSCFFPFFYLNPQLRKINPSILKISAEKRANILWQKPDGKNNWHGWKDSWAKSRGVLALCMEADWLGPDA